MTLKYMLTGLVKCGCCGRAMTPSSPKPYITKHGEERRYLAYVCPGYIGRICPNGKRVPEPWLREVVVEKIRDRLFGQIDGDLESQLWFQQLVNEVRCELARLATGQDDRRPALARELTQLESQIAGWSISLANPNLNPTLRAAVEAKYAEALNRRQRIENLLAENAAQKHCLDASVDPEEVIDRLNRLGDVLASNNPTVANLELSLHVETIRAYPDGNVVMRTCKLGLLPGVGTLFAGEHDASDPARTPEDADTTTRVVPRRRARLRVEESNAGGEEYRAAVDFAANPDRFAGLDTQWFWEDVFRIPKRKSWAEEHAAEVAEHRAAGITIAKLATHFGTTPPTIRSALRRAAAADPSVNNLPKKMPRARWHEDYALEVAAKEAEGFGTNQLVEHFGKSAPTILKALRYAAALEGQSETPATGA